MEIEGAGQVLQDPLGRFVVMHDRTWFGHILKDHPELVDSREDAHHAAFDPVAIYFSARSSEIRLYVGTTSFPGSRIVVAANSEDGAVRAAYWLSRERRMRKEWP